MGDKRQAQAFYKAGMEQYRAKRFEEAISSFDRAISLGDNSFVVLDGKAAAMNQLDGWRSAAYELSVKLCKAHGDKSHKPWYRKATILHRMKMYDAALSSLSRAQSLAREPSAIQIITNLQNQVYIAKSLATERRLAAAADSEAARLAEAKSKLNFIHLLPSDVLILISDFASSSDPGVYIRMSGTCKEWRGVMMALKRAWSKVILSTRRPVEKVKTFANRAGGYGIREVRISDRIVGDLANRVAEVLVEHIPRVEVLYLANNYRHFVVPWDRLMRNVHTIIQRRNYPPGSNNGVITDDRVYAFPPSNDKLAYGLLHPSCTTLRHLDLEVVKDLISLSTWGITSSKHNRRMMKKLKTFKMADGQISMMQPHDLRSILRWMPEVEVFELGALTNTMDGEPGGGVLGMWTANMFSGVGTPAVSDSSDHESEAGDATGEGESGAGEENEGAEGVEETLPRLDDFDPETKLVMSHLHTLTIHPRINMRDPFHNLFIPNLLHLDLNRFNLPPHTTTDLLSRPGIRDSLPNLISLDIGRCVLVPNRLIELGKEMKRLRFLNVSFTGLDNGFLEELIVERDEEDGFGKEKTKTKSMDGDESEGGKAEKKKVLFPSLTALSIAGNESITSGPINRFVLSRNPAYLEWKKSKLTSQQSQSSSQTVKRSLFAPTRRGTLNPTPNHSDLTLTSTFPSSTSTPMPPSKSTPTDSNKDKDNVATMTWLCLDLCTNPSLDVDVLLNLKKWVRFLSYNLSTKNDDRIRGKGPFAWDMDWTDGCEIGGLQGCVLKKRPGTDNSYYVHHVCKRVTELDNGSGKRKGEDDRAGVEFGNEDIEGWDGTRNSRKRPRS